eukprot:6461214-Amphidinium_carterae.1
MDSAEGAASSASTGMAESVPMVVETESRKRATDGDDGARLEGRDLHRLELTAMSDSLCQVRCRLTRGMLERGMVEKQQPMLLVLGALERPQNETVQESLLAATEHYEEAEALCVMQAAAGRLFVQVVPATFRGGTGWFSCSSGGRCVLSNSPVLASLCSGVDLDRLDGKEASRLVKASLSAQMPQGFLRVGQLDAGVTVDEEHLEEVTHPGWNIDGAHAYYDEYTGEELSRELVVKA